MSLPFMNPVKTAQEEMCRSVRHSCHSYSGRVPTYYSMKTSLSLIVSLAAASCLLAEAPSLNLKSPDGRIELRGRLVQACLLFGSFRRGGTS